MGSETKLASSRRQIELRNVRTNNLAGIDLDIPHGQMLVFCGVSGSGKSSLAFDTLYAEGQRRYLESLSPHTRQFVNRLDKPDADRIDGVPAAIAVKSFRSGIGSKVTVGSATEINEHLRLLLSKAGRLRCGDCDIDVDEHSPESVAAFLAGLDAGCRYQIAFPSDPDEDPDVVLATARKNGFARAIVGGATVDLSRPPSPARSAVRSTSEPIRVVVDRLKTGAADLSRVNESLEIAFQMGHGKCDILFAEPSLEIGSAIEIDGKGWRWLAYSRERNCQQCGRHFRSPEPRLFSFNGRFGACEKCQGVGLLGKSESQRCDQCHGGRLNQDAQCYYVGGKNLLGIDSFTIAEAIQFFDALSKSANEKVIQQIVPQISARLQYLDQVGLGYLTLGRSLKSLSAGEAQRVSLTSCLSSSLVDMLYVLDEPSVGLHPADIESLADTIGSLHRRSNTVVVVDHEPQLISAASRVVEVGPEAGGLGGEIVFDGTVDEMLGVSDSMTGDYLAGRRGVAMDAQNRRKPRGRLLLTGASGNNLKNLNVEFPLGCLCLVTGVSGAGKSSLVQQTLYRAIRQRKNVADEPALPYEELFGESNFDDVVLVDRSPIGRSPRSNPVTYVKAFDDIRRTFAETADASSHNIKAGHFSFNVVGGRCDKCAGEGQLTIDMQFLSDVYVTCDQCHGTRYRDEVLAVRYRGKNIAEVLNLTVHEAFSFFRGQPKVQSKLKSLIDVGLDYIRLGQPATTLSSGEAQRLKLGSYLNASKSKRALFILDEPTTGLHMRDVTRLSDCFDALLSVGHSLIVVEHNLQLMSYADWIIDLGPGAAELGGQLVVAGTPETVAACDKSITGKFLKAELENLNV